ncbi:MAG: sigma-54-dependent Fis family transcriptional regulator [Pseudomonadota bacterium]
MDQDNSKPDILIVDDQPENIRILADLLKQKYSPMAATNGSKALEHAMGDNKPDLILLDIMMPEMDGYEVCRRLKADKKSCGIPIIFITALSDAEDETRGFELGAADYITKPFNPDIVEARVQTHLELKAHRDHLENLVKNRTWDLQETNRRLRETLDELKNEIAFRKSIENKLRASESKLASIINAFQGFIFTCDKDSYHIDFMNQALIAHIGGDKSGELCHKVIFGNNSPCRWCALDDDGKLETVEVEIEHQQRCRWYHAFFSPVLDSNGQLIKRQAIFFDITKQKLAEKELQEREAYLRKENIRLKSSMKDRFRFRNIIGKSRPMQNVYEAILQAAITGASVVIYGESGTGKELVAQAIHAESDRAGKPLISVNCAAIPEKLAESEFFGHKKGAFTNADSDKIGYLELADGGSLFLDEIGETNLDLQAKLLRAIEGAGYTPVGSREIKKPNFRIIAATSKDLKMQVKKGLMRDDFYYRIHVIPIYLPPLRERKEDVPLLIDYFLKQYPPEIRPAPTAKILGDLYNYDWPGNVRELQNTLLRFVTLKKLDFMGIDLMESNRTDVADLIQADTNETMQAIVEKVEKKLISDALNRYQWRKGKVAEALGLDPKTLFRKIKKYELTKI